LSTLIQQTFEALKRQGKKAIIPFLTADFPNRDHFLQLLHALPNEGASMIEIGIPFSDPMADGTVIQRTSEQAIKQGFQLNQCLNDVAEFKQIHPGVPIVLMTYVNPLMQYGMRSFLNNALTAQVDGLLMVDAPPEHHHRIIPDDTPLNMIRLVTPTTDTSRLSVIQDNASGFIYYVSVKGITGSQVPDASIVSEHLSMIKHNIDLPMVIGFGISNAAIAKEMAMISDGVVVGSSLIKPYLDAPEVDYSMITKQQLAFIADMHQVVNHG
tara:strand:+ start:59 stop:865 length:807 start_codon:yes stop_codon:yes gene_type:complete